MTYKHGKFQDSQIMRSLEKIAVEKGLIKPEALQKKASVAKKADFTPTTNLMDNIFKLCSGMRAQGLESEAFEIETNYLNYKQAQTLYEAHKETGEDLIHAAHPEGSHKMEGVDCDEATFEDILDRQVKMLQVINKKPSGKLSSALHILGAVKKALGQTNSVPEKNIIESIKEVAANLEKVYSLVKKTGGLTDITSNWMNSRLDVVRGLLNVANTSPESLSADQIDNTISAVNAIARNLHPNLLHNILPNFLNKGVSSDALWNGVEPILTAAVVDLQNISKKIVSKQINNQPIVDAPVAAPAAPEKAVKQELIDRLNSVNRNLALYSSYLPVRIAPSAQNQAKTIISNYKSQADALLAYLKDASDQEAMSKSGSVDQLEKWVSGFATNWKLA